MDRFEKAYRDPIPRPPRRRRNALTGNAVFTGALFLATMALATDAIDPDALKRLVVQDCGSCHGLTLKGGLGPDLRPETIEHYDVEVLRDVILDGIPDTPMPPWRPLMSEAEAEWVARYLLSPEDMQ
ncbi:c-type cytochrome [Shimia sp. W99]|uniref:Cytochrome c55X n=1 Tax=Shimia aestuarii TaxID=254406 RepID=A0A1I4KDN2_9RHOB|nr:cytochrome c55X [Shimia aestuarii]